MKKEDDLNWVAGLALDAVGGLIIGEATKALIRVQKKHAKAVFDAVQYGSDPSKLSEQIAGLSKAPSKDASKPPVRLRRSTEKRLSPEPPTRNLMRRRRRRRATFKCCRTPWMPITASSIWT
jgi:hypothetical protein